MATEPPVLDEAAAQPLVSCTACGFAWYGRTAAHGLSVIGRCPRCRGALDFHGGGVEPAGAEPPESDLQPWQVLGAPTSWSAP
jgi:hypothetical protein